MLLLVELQAKASDFTEGSALPWIFFCFSSCTDGAESRNVSDLKFLIFYKIILKLYLQRILTAVFRPVPS